MLMMYAFMHMKNVIIKEEQLDYVVDFQQFPHSYQE